jgi:hypothetical protein
MFPSHKYTQASRKVVTKLAARAKPAFADYSAPYPSYAVTPFLPYAVPPFALSYRAKQGSQILLSLDLFRPTHNFPDRVERDRIFQGGQISGVASFRSG